MLYTSLKAKLFSLVVLNTHVSSTLGVLVVGEGGEENGRLLHSRLGTQVALFWRQLETQRE